MAFDMDTGPQGAAGPYLNWSANGTQDGAVPAKSFYISDKDMPKTVIDAFSKGVVLDIDGLKTGWQQEGGAIGVAPKWVLGTSPAALPDKPGDDFRKGFQMRVAIGGGKSAQWNQAGAGAWGALADLSPQLRDGSASNPGKLPVVILESVKHVQFTKGSTQQPVLKVVKWVDRPDSLKGAGMALDTGAAEPPAAQAASPAQEPPKAAPAHADDF